MKRLLQRAAVLWLYSLLIIYPTLADQGMWLPLFLKDLNEDRMQELGMRITANDIYSINEGSLKDAIVSFGGYCTGQVISPEGLLLTNHHCGYGEIQSHSTVENDLLTKGFWAMNRSEELPSPGLFVSFIVRIEDVTAQVLEGMDSQASDEERETLIQSRIKSLAETATKGTHYDATIKPFYYGSEYYMFVTESFTDVRLVGAPPSSIGKYGGDTDNWEWPRHTGDFSMFRIYTAPDGTPAEYAEENVPLKPKRFLNISLGGVDPGDFTMVFGFPGRTQQFLTSPAVKLLLEETNPHRISIREAKLAVMDQHMQADDKVRIQYASKYASTANYWKKWIGESMGLERYNAIAVKEAQEAAFQTWVAQDATRQKKYGSVLEDISKHIHETQRGNLAFQYLQEGFLRHDGIQYLGFLSQISGLANAAANASGEQGKAMKARLRSVAERAKGFLKDYDPATDKAVFREMTKLYMENVPKDFALSTFLQTQDPTETFYQGEWYTEAWLMQQIENPGEMQASVNQLPAIPLLSNVQQVYGVASEIVSGPQDAIESLSKIYVEGLRAMNADQAYAPDANSTLRIAFGQVGGMNPRDGLIYRHYTTLEGVVEKGQEGVVATHEFYLEPKLKELYEAKDYGQWADADGYLPVGFLANNHTTGGNSGSPVLDADGNLIGLNFDRTWQSTMSDVMYNGEICRNIAVDVRYICFIVDKFAGASHLIDEMNFVNAAE